MLEVAREIKVKAIAIAEEMIAGKTSILSGCRMLSDLDMPEDDQDFLEFSAIASETDDLPRGQERELWAPEVLKEKDVEIARYEELLRATAIEACESIIRKWK